MIELSVTEAKARFSWLLRRVAVGEEVVITRAGRPVARVVRCRMPGKRRVLGQDRGLFEVPGDFDAPLPDDVLDASEGRP